MAMPISRPDPSSPSEVAAAAFSTSRRGFDQAEVREFLRMVAAEIARLQEREGFLERELRSAQRTNAGGNIVLDDELVTRMLGEEATRVLQTAREGAAQIKLRAEEGAARLLREATDESQRLREEAEVEAARKRNDAAADGEAELQMAKQQGREMVKEARDYRERVLSELARRRELARQQIEQLGHGRDRLMQAFERARLVSIDVMAELTPLSQPDEYVNLSPTTGPVPMMVPASNATPTRVEREPVDDPAGDVDATVALTLDAPQTEIPVAEETAAVQQISAVEEIPVAEETAAVEDVADQTVDDVADDPADQTVDDVADDETPDGDVEDETFEMIAVVDVVDDQGTTQHYEMTKTIERLHDVDPSLMVAAVPEAEEPAQRLDIGPSDDLHSEDDDHRDPAPVVELFGDDRSRAGKPSVEELFAKLRAARTDQVARQAHSDATNAAVASVTSELVAVADAAVDDANPAADDTANADDANADADADADAVADADDTDDANTDADAATATATATAPAQPDVITAATTPAGEDSVFLATPDAPQVAVLVDDSPFARRDEALTPIIVGAARRLKRILADEQNEVLHTLRRNDPVRTIDVIVPTIAEHESRYGSAIESDLLDAALAGATSMGTEPADVRREFVRSGITRSAHDVLAAELIRPLRDRLARAVSDADGDNDELSNLIRTVYREWKNQRIDEQLDDVVQMAFGRGALASITPGTKVHWIVDPSGPACSDAEDNALGGKIDAGQPFPTDHLCAPAHRGCRCMIAPAP